MFLFINLIQFRKLAKKKKKKTGIFLNVKPGRVPTQVLSREDILLAC